MTERINMTTPIAIGGRLAVLGIARAFIAALADVFDIGEHGFGWKQIVGVIVGLAAFAVGAVVLVAARSSGRSDESAPVALLEDPERVLKIETLAHVHGIERCACV